MPYSRSSKRDTANEHAESRADIVRVAIALGLLAALASFDNAEERSAPRAALAANADVDTRAD